jgi:O-antigen/teichoic acid export membrane protein
VSGPDPAQAGSGAIFRRILRNAGKLLGGRALNAGLSLLYMALTARALGVKGLGAVVVINAFAQLVSDVVKFQSWQTVLQFGAEPLAEGRLQDLQRVLRFTVLLDLGSSVVGVSAGAAVALLFGDRFGLAAGQGWLAAAYTVTAGFMTAAAPIGVLRLLDRFDLLAAQAAVNGLVRAVLCAIGYVLHAGLGYFLIAWAAGTLAAFALIAAGAWRELRRRELLTGFRWLASARINAPGVWRFAWATNLNATLGTSFTHLVTLVIGALIGPADAALWRIGRQVADSIAKPVRMLMPALYPELVRLRAGGRVDTMWRLTRKIALAAGAVGALLLAVCLFAGGPLLQLVMGAAFVSAAGVMSWQVAAAVIDLAAVPLEPMVISLGQASATVKLRVVVAAAYAASLPLLVRWAGLHGAGAGLVATSLAIAGGMLWLLLRQRPAVAERI